MADPFKRARATALRLVKKYGQICSLHEVTPFAYDPMSPTVDMVGILRTCSVSGVVLPTSDSTLVMFDQALKTDPQITKDTRFVLVPALGNTFQPEVGMILVTKEGPYKIDFSTPLNPQGDNPILYRLKCSMDVSIKLPTDPEDGELIGGDELI